MERTLRAVWTVLLAASLVAVAVLNRSASGGTGGGAAAAAAEAGPRLGFRLEESARAAGIDFVHRAPTFDAQLDHIMPQIASMGAAVAVADFDRDGWQDLYAVNSGEGSRNALYRNRGDGTFEDVAAAVGLADLNRLGTGVSTGRALGRLRQRRVRGPLPAQVGPPRAVPQRGGAPLRRGRRARRAAAVGQRPRRGLARLRPRRPARPLRRRLLAGGPRPLAPRDHPDHARELRVRRERRPQVPLPQPRRRHVSRRSRRSSASTRRRWTLAVAAADLHGTGWPDLFLANDYGVAELYRNHEGQRFEEVGRETGVGRQPKSGMNVSFGDVFNHGRLAIYRTNISEPGALVQGNNLWVPMTAPGEGLRYENLASSRRRRPRRLELGRAVRRPRTTTARSTSTSTNGYISAAERDQLLVRLLPDRGRPQRASSATRATGRRCSGRSLSGYQR